MTTPITPNILELSSWNSRAADCLNTHERVPRQKWLHYYHVMADLPRTKQGKHLPHDSLPQCVYGEHGENYPDFWVGFAGL